MPTAITERFGIIGTDGELELLTSCSTWPVAQIVTHAGIVKVKQYGFSIL